ncbi:major facilitator superfamily domain-containing protein [Cercophora newfieldiana]|uniref:Major facilitator superfamily domain-containing protein n=1 Tax=Cercophora newfieldiana TaxID=92897 RepID=A0AA39XRW4_9PEZI|nr:major facilitator superfamily domain-containing protein [Cercophora newfieldiana]
MSDEKVAVAAPATRASIDQHTPEKTSLEHKSDVSNKGEAAATTVAPPDADPALKEWLAKFDSRDAALNAAMNKKMVWKMDLHLLPCLIVMYLLNFLDRANLAQARQGSLEADLGMTGSDFNLATSIFFVAYLLMQLPSNLLITRVRPSLYLSVAMVLWGCVSACNAATRKFGDLIAVRFILGFVEAPFFPGAVFLMSSWYTRAELTRRMSYFYSGNALANMFGGIIGAAVLGNMDGAQGIAGWRWLFIIEGVVTIAFAAVVFMVLPDYPSTTKWLSDEERAFAQWRLLQDINETDEATSIWAGLKLALTDYRLYLFVLLQHLSLLSQTFQYFFPSIVQTLGYDKITTLWLTVPVWFGTFLVSVAVTFTSAKTADRSLHIFGLMVFAAVGNAIATGSSVLGARFFAMFLMPMGAVPAYQILLAWISNSFPRPLVKRSSALAIANMVGNTASIYGSYMYPASDAPQYVPGGSANAVICLLVASLGIALRYVHKWENKKLEKAEAEDAANAENGVVADAAVDRRAVGFRYIY